MQLDLLEAAALRDDGIQRAADHADREHEGWTDRALAAVTRYALRAEDAFMMEDVRRSSDLPEPPDARSWGSVAQRAKRLGIIKPAGFGLSRNKQAHLRPTALWRRP